MIRFIDVRDSSYSVRRLDRKPRADLSLRVWIYVFIFVALVLALQSLFGVHGEFVRVGDAMYGLQLFWQLPWA